MYEGPLRDAIHALKYKRDIGLGEELAQHLIKLFEQQNWYVDMIAPVPLGKERLENRGYNQSHLLALPIALSSRIPYKPDVIKRIRNTPSQVGLNSLERLHNVRGAFQGNTSVLKGKSILLVDDVTTTGATINACAQACHQAQAANVYCITVARAPFAHSTD